MAKRKATNKNNKTYLAVVIGVGILLCIACFFLGRLTANTNNNKPTTTNTSNTTDVETTTPTLIAGYYRTFYTDNTVSVLVLFKSGHCKKWSHIKSEDGLDLTDNDEMTCKWRLGGWDKVVPDEDDTEFNMVYHPNPPETIEYFVLSQPDETTLSQTSKSTGETINYKLVERF